MTPLGFPLIHNLAIQRRGVWELLERIKSESLHSDEGLNLLFALQVRVLFHLRVEDELLVAVLDSEARQRPEVAAAMNQWAHPFRGCAEEAQAFFQLWLGREGGDGIDAGDLRAQWESLKGLLEQRMKTAERVLYPAYRALYNERHRKSRASR
ncbi:MAG: hypothetical protein KGN80_05070 [Acidobacteriota bacterium]|nr:hypothetical protein [Acidobacteriota bacterium]